MKTVRFSSVVETCGRPEVYLVLSKDDPEFTKALKAHRIMSITGDHAASAHGEVGFEATSRAQLLLFPNSLASFEGARIVGIKYDLFSEPEDQRSKKLRGPTHTASQSKVNPLRSTPQPKPKKKSEHPEEREPERKAPEKKHADFKLLSFPKQQAAGSELRDLKQQVRKALAALEKDRPMLAARLLTEILNT